jgi:hypothetical protein
MEKAGNPNRKSTSTVTGYPSMPWRAADDTRENIESPFGGRKGGINDEGIGRLQ